MSTGLYVHVPFCARACPYCDFDFKVGVRPDTDTFIRGVVREWARRGGDLGRPFDTLYVGGGTPSLLSPATLGSMLDALGIREVLETSQECTIEVNPEHAKQSWLEDVRALGFDRISLGVQTLSSAGLRQLGRVHGCTDALAGLKRASAVGFRVSADLIVGWDGQTAHDVIVDCERVVAAGADHVSVYALTIEGDIPWLALVKRGLRVLPDRDVQADLLEQAERTLVGLGLEHYEVSSYARSGQRALHNLKYWRWCDYLGLGPSAHSARYGAQGEVVRSANPRGLARWLTDSNRTDDALDPEASAAEGLWLGLRVLDGLDTAVFFDKFRAVDRPWLERRVARQLDLGNLEWLDCGRTLRVAAGRWLWHDGVAADLLAREGA